MIGAGRTDRTYSQAVIAGIPPLHITRQIAAKTHTDMYIVSLSSTRTRIHTHAQNRKETRDHRSSMQNLIDRQIHKYRGSRKIDRKERETGERDRRERARALADRRTRSTIR